MTHYFVQQELLTGDLVKGIEITDNKIYSETLITHKSTNLKKIFKLILNIE